MKSSNWQDVRLDFFREEVWPRFWNHTGRTKDIIIEVQYMPALLCGEPWRRAFIGFGLSFNFPYSQRKESLGDYILKEHGINAYQDCEKNFALGFCMTGDEIYKVDYVPLSYNLPSKDVFMQNLGVDYEGASNPIFFWYNLKDGKIDLENIRPTEESMIRVRYLDVEYFMEMIKAYVESDYKKFPQEFTKDDYVLEN